MPLNLNLGCCDRILPGYVNVDLYPPCDMVVDLQHEWPWQDSSVDYILAHDVIEHLPDKIHTMNSIWRVLKDGGIAEIKVPTVKGVGAFCDPTHKSYWSASDFEYYEKGNFARERFRNHYGIVADFKIGNIAEFQFTNRYCGDVVWHVHTVLRAVK